MTVQLRLAEQDRERLGCPEWMDLDLEYVPIEEAEAIDEAGGDWTDLTEGTAKGTKTRVWLALHRAGADPPSFDEFTFNVGGLSGRDDGGKDEGSADESASTPPTSDSSTPD